MMEPATNLSVDVQPIGRRLGLSMQIEPTLNSGSRLHNFVEVEILLMAYIDLPVAPELGREFPGIVGLMTFRPETAAPLNELVNVLLRGESTLTRGERELIATHVSWRNDCFFCQTIHGAVAAAQLGDDEQLVQTVKKDWINADISLKMKALLNIAGKVQQGGKHVTEDDVTAARAQGATDREIHDTVLIAAVFCMANRYVDGLGTWAPQQLEIYRANAAKIVAHGYSAVTESATAAVTR
jgi:uncharacterized peroxidase-related enzyme